LRRVGALNLLNMYEHKVTLKIADALVLSIDLSIQEKNQYCFFTRGLVALLKNWEQLEIMIIY